jgi:hypothetical protein
MEKHMAIENEGLQWLARQLAWEERLEQLHAADSGESTEVTTVEQEHDLAA